MNDAAVQDGRDRLYAMAVVVAVASLVTAGIFALYLGLPLRDPDGFLGPTYVRLPAIAGVMLALDVVPRALLRTRSLRRTPRESVVVLRERWPWHRLRPAIIGLLAFYATYVSYRNLKSYLPFLRPDLVDRELRALDESMTGGTPPAELLHDLLGTGVSAQVLSWVYLAFLMFVPLSLGLALVPIGRAREASWYVTALCLNWTLGTASYYFLPSLGPVYAQPGLFADLPETGTSRLQDSLLISRSLVIDDPHGSDRIQSIAAFASLHVSIVLTAALIAQFAIRSIGIRTVMWTFFTLTAIATIYFGWHYLLDDLAGVVIAVTSVLLAGWGTGWFRRPRTAPEVLPEQVGERTRPVGERFRQRPQTSPSSS